MVRASSGLLGLRYYITNRITARCRGERLLHRSRTSKANPYPREAAFTPNIQVGLSGLFRNSAPVPTVVTRYDTVRVTQTRVQSDTVFRERMSEATSGVRHGAAAAPSSSAP